jgi:putative membrane protein
MRWIAVLTLLSFFANPLLAHDGVATPADLWAHWNTNPLLLGALLIPLLLFKRGSGTYPLLNWRKLAFIAGIAILMLALISPLDALSGALFSAHMIQHLLLILIAAPLLILSRPLAPFLRALPASWARTPGILIQKPFIQRIWRQLSSNTTALFLHILALWLWHLPALYSLALLNPVVHALEHASFFLTAALFWWAIYRSNDYAPRVLSVFIVMMASSLLGALMTFATQPWYPEHEPYTSAWGLNALEDQQLAGLFMWIPPGFIYVLIAAFILAAWINSVERKTLERERRLAKEIRDG